MSDTRDLRDPQEIGQQILRGVIDGGLKPTQAYDEAVCLMPIRNVSKDDSMGKVCVREYRKELEFRAAGGDKYARSALESIDAGQGVQGYDDAGV